MGRPPCCDKSYVKKGPWTAEEDAKIVAYVSTHGLGNWTSVPKKAGLKRCGKSCRLRYTNYLRPDLKRESFTPQEENMIVYLHATIGSRWSTIAQYLPGRTDNDVKNYWNTKLKKKLIQEGIDPITHKPISEIMLTLGGLPPSRTTSTAAAATTSNTGKSGRISCLNRDLKNVFMSRSDSILDPMVALQNMPETSGYDLLTQLQAIRLVADVSNGAMLTAEMTTILSELPPQICTSTCTSNATTTPYFSPASSSSSNAAPPQPCAADDLNWSDFLVDDVIMCIDDGRDKEGSDTPGEVLDVEKPPMQATMDGDSSDPSGFMEPLQPSLLDLDFPEFLLDDDPLDFGHTDDGF